MNFFMKYLFVRKIYHDLNSMFINCFQSLTKETSHKFDFVGSCALKIREVKGKTEGTIWTPLLSSSIVQFDE